MEPPTILSNSPPSIPVNQATAFKNQIMLFSTAVGHGLTVFQAV